MDALLIGAAQDGAFFSLERELRKSTLEAASRKFGRIIAQYSPWLCYAPVVDELPPELIYYTPPAPGGLVIDHAELVGMAAYMAGPGRMAIEELPGDPNVWLPSGNNISNVYDEAIAILRRSPFMAKLFDQMVDFVVPLGGGRNRGYSTHFVRGAIFRSLPADNDAYDVAIDIGHEIGHQVLMVWQSVDPILTSDPAAPVFSQIRRTDRPAIQSFHATVALAYMRSLELAMPDDEGMQAAAARRGATYSKDLSHSLGLALDTIRKDCATTELGHRMVEEMEAYV